MDLYLVEPDEGMEQAVMRYRNEYIAQGENHINGSAGLMYFTDYSEWLERIVSAKMRETSWIDVPATTYCTVRKSDGKIIGTIQLRHELNDYLAKRGGHIGYGITPLERGKGYGTVQLALVLEKARNLGLQRVMITCDKTNTASAQVAINNGGKLEWEGYDEEDGEIRIYWINL